MKSIGKLTDFMRNHMLDKQDVTGKINEIKRNYDNLTKSHEAVQRAKKQLDLLVPLDKDIRTYQDLSKKSNQVRKSIDFLPVFFSEKKSVLLEKEIQSQNTKLERVKQKITTISLDLERLNDQGKSIHLALNSNKEGQMIAQLESKKISLEQEKEQKYRRNQEYSELCKELSFPKDPDEDTFHKSLAHANDVKLTAETDLSTLVTQRDGVVTEYLKLRDLYDADTKELNSLTRRRSKIPEKNIQIRELILNNLGFEESELPFIGELLQIKSEEKKWEGAIEHVLHSFGLSILVAERDYREVSSFVDKKNLKEKIVYYKIPERLAYPKQKDPEKNSLIGKIDIKADSEFSKWISMELFDRFNFICCESIEQFQRETRAITLNGQIKGNRGRHEKDDEKSIHDQRYYILGWNNQEKISRIKQGIANLENNIKDTDERKSEIEEKKKFLETRKTCAHDLLKFKEYAEINWKKSAQEIERCEAEIEEIKKTSDLLKTLKAKLEKINADIKARTDENIEFLKQVGETESRIRDYEQSLLECKKILSEQPLESAQDLMPIIHSILSDGNFTIKNIDAERDSARNALTQMFDENSKYEGNVSRAIISKMNNFNHEYPEDTFEMIAAIESILEYQKFYEKLKTEDLPRYEQRFKEQLNEGTINDIAMFKSQLEDNAKQIEKNIKTINESLREIDYSPGTYIELLSEKISDVEIADFKIQLKYCLEGTISGEKDVYSEDKFNQVKRILDRFNSGNTADINWTNKVTDVRNWFSFSAMEKNSVDGSDKEFYSDSSGKSGGQKEKLALTILASALAYQFGPAGDNPRSKSFRFVIIDEAFSRGSDESTRYGMDLFKKLDLQLLMITPLQKIHVIENYINCVHLVSNDNGNNSMIRDIPIQEYHEMKSKQVVISD